MFVPPYSHSLRIIPVGDFANAPRRLHHYWTPAMFLVRSHYFSLPWRLAMPPFSVMEGSTRPHSTHSTSQGLDPYKVLGVRDSATQAQIKSAYYKLSKKYHPDRNEGSKSSQDMFSRINDAYSILGNTKLRRRYDRGVLTHRERMGHKSHHYHQEPREERQASARHMGTDQFTASFRSAHAEHVIDEFLKKRLHENLGRHQEYKKHQHAREEEYRQLQQKVQRTPFVVVGLLLVAVAASTAKLMGLGLPVTRKFVRAPEHK